MPLSPAGQREHLHTRNVQCQGFRRPDGLWEIEGRIVDVKTYAFDNEWRGRVEAGTPVHEMWIRLTVDDTLTIRAVEAKTDHSPYRVCGDIAPAFQKLVGLRMVPGFTGKTRELLGGTEGCTHLVELLGPVATTAFQTVYSRRERQKRAAADPAAAKKRPRIIDTCHALAADGEVVKRFWPDFYTGPK